MDKRAFFILTSTMFISMLGFGLLIPLLPIYANTLGASNTEIGLISAGFSISNVIFLPVMGRLSDRFGRKLFLCTGLSLMTIISFLFLWAADAMDLILLRLLHGFSTSMHFPVAQAYLGDMTPEGQEGKWMGYFNSVLFAGLGAGPLFGGSLHDLLGMDAVFIVTGLLVMMSLIATLLFLREPEKKESSHHAKLSFSVIRNSSVLKGLLVLQISVGVVFSVTMTFIPILANQKLALSATLIGVLLAIRTPVSMIQSYTGRFADTHNRYAQIIGGNLIILFFMILLPFSTGFWMLLVFNALIMLGMVISQPAATAFVVEEGRIYGMGAAMALFMTAMQIGSSVGPIAIGGIIDIFGLDAGFFAGSFMVMLGILFFSWEMRHAARKKTVSVR